MITKEHETKKYCCFYASDFHLEMILLPYIKNNIQIIHKIELDSMQESIATLKKNMCNKATIEFIKDIKSYYNK